MCVMAADRVLGRRWAVVVAALALFLTAPSGLHAQTQLDDQVRAIAAGLRCPVCQNLSVADSPSDMARTMREVIREQLRAGKTPDEVRAYFVAKYGDWILLAPRPRGLSLFVWLGPFAAVAVGALVAIRAVRRWSRRPARRERAAADPVAVARLRGEVGRDRETLGLAETESLSPLQLERGRLYDALREIEFDHRAGKLSAADYEALRADYEDRALVVLGELDRAAEPTALPMTPKDGRPPAAHTGRHAGSRRRSVARRPWRLAAAAVFLAVFAVILGYALTTSLRPRMGEQDTLTGDFLTGTGPGGIMPGSRDAARNLATALASGRAAYERQDWRAAIDAFKGALAIDRDNAEAHAFIALVLLHAGHGEEALRAADRALTRAATYPFGLWVKGVVLFEGKREYAGAIEAWERLMAQRLGETDADRVAQAIVEARTRLAAAPNRGAPAARSERTITGTITVAPALRAAAPPNAVLYIIARQGDGPPLAVKRIPNPTFPLSFGLSEEDRMVGRRQFEGEVMVVARLKRDGVAGPPGPGDIEGRSRTPVKVGERSVAIVLDTTY
jgi:cytochrome c-type biogenesis protein CcmH